ncbi:hypothetical protein ACIRPU_43345 [Streptomyces sp. NPDC102259]|uniref:hypothetical protein n=1 Tax=Streptomyces sp. NPDC102259 TaxID=3366148 RepID=UPI00381D9433
MTSPLDWAGLVSAVTATAQAAAVMVQVYWDRRQRGTGTTEHANCRLPHHGKASLPDTRVLVQVNVEAHACTSLTLVVLMDGGGDGTNPFSLSMKGNRPW